MQSAMNVSEHKAKPVSCACKHTNVATVKTFREALL